jgi:hypothetical protein
VAQLGSLASHTSLVGISADIVATAEAARRAASFVVESLAGVDVGSSDDDDE